MTHFTRRPTTNRTTQNKSVVHKSEQPQDMGRRRQHVNPREQHHKYMLMAKEAISAGNHIDAEQYYQHAEHYYRIVAERSIAAVAGRQDLG